MLIPLGILGASGAGFISDYDLIATTILGTDTSSVSFSSLGDYASTYKHLQLRMALRSTSNAGIVIVRMNGNTGNVYSWHNLFGNGSSVNSTESNSAGSMDFGLIPGTNQAANIFAGTVIDILDAYSSSKNKTIRTFTGSAVSGASEITLGSGLYINTGSTTQITISTYSNLATGSRLSLYGVK
jgi:hypothetical protein